VRRWAFCSKANLRRGIALGMMLGMAHYIATRSSVAKAPRQVLENAAAGFRKFRDRQ
jgi:hypothetical protein